MIVGITGGIGSGKTTFCKALEGCGASVYYCDQRAKSLYDDGDFCAVIQNEILSGEPFSLQSLSNRVFSDRALLKKLENLVYSRLEVDFEEWLEEHKSEKVVFVESAIFPKAPWLENQVDVMVEISSCDSLLRAADRDNVSLAAVRARAEAQPISSKISITITNNGSVAELSAKAAALYKEFNDRR